MVNKDKVIIHKILDKIDLLTGRQFEFYTALLFKLLGYHIIKVTREFGDYGTDVIIRGQGGAKLGIQCKHISKNSKNHVGYNAIEETLGGRIYYKLDGAMVITNGYYSQQSIDGSKQCHVKLLNRDWIIKKLRYLEQSSQKQVNISELLNIKGYKSNIFNPQETLMNSIQKKFYNNLPRISYPIALLIDKNLTPLDRALLSIILDIVSRTGEFYQTNTKLAQVLGVSESTVKRGIKQLGKDRYITYSNFMKNGRMRRYITSINYQKLGELNECILKRMKKAHSLTYAITTLKAN